MTDERRIPVSKAARASSTTTIVTWVLCVATFVGIYAAASPGSSISLGLVLGIIGALVLAVIVVATIAATRQTRRFVAENTDGIAMLARGEMQRAHDLFWRWSEDASSHNVAALARHNLGWTLIRQGKLDQAIEVLTENEKSRERVLKAMTLLPTSGADIAFAHALRGNLDAAQTWLTRTHDRAALPHQPSFPGMLAFARAVVQCRTGNAADAARSLDEQWSQCESILTGSEIRPLRVLRAFAHAAADTRNAGIAESLLASSKPVYAGEYTFLGVAWPEMHAFLAAHGLS